MKHTATQAPLGTFSLPSLRHLMSNRKPTHAMFMDAMTSLSALKPQYSHLATPLTLPRNLPHLKALYFMGFSEYRLPQIMPRRCVNGFISLVGCFSLVRSVPNPPWVWVCGAARVRASRALLRFTSGPPISYFVTS